MRTAAPGGDGWSEGWGVGEGQAGGKGWRGDRVAEGSAGEARGGVRGPAGPIRWGTWSLRPAAAGADLASTFPLR